jgi:hypothetical protein
MSLQRLILACALAAGGMISLVSAQTTTTPIVITRDHVFPPVTLATTETARIIVVNTATAPAATASTPSAAPSCTGTMAFTLSSGTSTAPVTFTVGAGQFAIANMPFTNAGIVTSPGEVVGKVALTTDLSTRTPCNLAMSLEVFDTTSGVGHVVLTSPTITGGIGPTPIPIPLQGGSR